MNRRPIPYAALLFGVNAYVCWRLFGIEYLDRMESIEAAYIGISRHMLTSWGDLSWWPAWYGGIPFHNSYPPLLHAFTALIALVLQVSTAHAHHIAGALVYCSGPVFAYLLMAGLSGKRFASFCAALFYTVVSPSGYMVRAIAQDLQGSWRPRRLSTLIAYGDGPHLASLALLPLAILLLHRALEKRRPMDWGLAACGFIAVACTNWLGGFSLAVISVCYLTARGRARDWLAAAALGVAAYCVAMPVLPPSLVRTIQFNARVIGGNFVHYDRALIISAPFAIAGFLALKFAVRRLAIHLQLLILFTAVMCWITLGYMWFGIAVVPQPDRYHLEMDLGITLLLAMCAAGLPLRVKRAAAVLLFAVSLPLLYWGHRYARSVVRPIDIRSTLEYQSAHWIDGHMRGARVFVPSTTQFWFSAFTDTPEVGGGFDQGEINPISRGAIYQILSGQGAGEHEAEYAILWLRAFGAHAVQAGGPRTRDFYHPYVNGNKFRNALPELWREGDDAIYLIPSRTLSLAHVMTREDLVKRPPINGIDVEEVRRYDAALEHAAYPDAPFVWRTQHSAEILAQLQRGQVVSVQENFHPGWKASVNGSPVAVEKDGLGHIVIAPACEGECRINLVYDGGLEARVARWLCGTTILCWVIWVLWSSSLMRNFRAARSSE